MDATRSAAVRKAWRLWPEAILRDLEGNRCYTEVAVWYVGVGTLFIQIPFCEYIMGAVWRSASLKLRVFFVVAECEEYTAKSFCQENTLVEE